MKQQINYITIVAITILFVSCSEAKKLERQAQKGDVYAIDQLITIYSGDYWNGYFGSMKTPKKDTGKAIYWCDRGIAALDSSMLSQFLMAKAHLVASPALQFPLYKKAAELNDENAQWILGLIYLEGRDSVKRNIDSAYYYIKKASESGLNYATYEIGSMFEDKYLIDNTGDSAMFYYKKACLAYKEPDLTACEKVIQFYLDKKTKRDTLDAILIKDRKAQIENVYSKRAR